MDKESLYIPLSLPLQVIFVDANVLYVRIFRDYLLYAAEKELISVVWSKAVLDEATRNLITNNPSFTEASAKRLRTALEYAFPDAKIDPGEDDYSRLVDFKLPDENDRHVLAAALAAEATIICTSNVKDFPVSVTSKLGITIMIPDDLLRQLIESYPQQMLAVHADVVANLANATDTSTIQALSIAGARKTAFLLSEVLGTEPKLTK